MHYLGYNDTWWISEDTPMFANTLGQLTNWLTCLWTLAEIWGTWKNLNTDQQVHTQITDAVRRQHKPPCYPFVRVTMSHICISLPVGLFHNRLFVLSKQEKHRYGFHYTNNDPSFIKCFSKLVQWASIHSAEALLKQKTGVINVMNSLVAACW